MNDKSQFDVISHLTDIPMLGKQYVPGLWRQFEGGSEQMEPMDQSNVTPSTSTQPQKEKKNTLAQITGFCRPIDKRTCAGSDSAPAAKVSRRC